MPREDALKVAETFQSLIRGYTKEQALAALTPDFVDHTSAVSIIINKGGSEPEDVTEPVFTSRDEFMKGHGTQEPIPYVRSSSSPVLTAPLICFIDSTLSKCGTPVMA